MGRRLQVALGALVGVMSAGTIGYMLISGVSFVEALYMTVITITTVGYREVLPVVGPAEMFFTIVLVFAGVAGIGYSFGVIVEFMVEGQLAGILEGRRMHKRISELTGHYIVAGIGSVGSVVARELADAGRPLVVVDSGEERLQTAQDEGWLFIHGDATDEHVLVEAGVERAAGLVAAVDTDADNLFISLTARTLNPSIQIVARSSAITSEGKILRSGANRVITPNVIGGRRMAAMLLKPAVSDYLDVVSHGEGLELRLDARLLSASSALVGRSIGESRLHDRTGVFIVGLRPPNGPLNVQPKGSDVLAAGDEIIALGTPEQLEAFYALG